MRRIPLFLVMAICGLALMGLSVMTMFAVDFQPNSDLAPTMMAMLTRMSPDTMLARLARRGIVFRRDTLATAEAMLNQGAPVESIIGTMVASLNDHNNGWWGGHQGDNNNNQQPAAGQPGANASQPTAVAVIPLPTAVPVIPQPTAAGVVPLPTAMPPVAQPTSDSMIPLPTAVDALSQDVVPLPTAVDTGAESMAEATAEMDNEVPVVEAPAASPQVGTITGTVTYSGSESGAGIILVLTRPDGTTLDVPVSGDGTFAFSGMEPGGYTLNASANGYLSTQAAFTLDAGQDLILHPAALAVGDTNGDNVIDLLDAALIASNFGGAALVAQADLNHDGQVDVRDLALVGSEYGTVGPVTWP